MIPDYLHSIAEISIGLAGFSGLMHAALQFVHMLFIQPRNTEHVCA